MSILNDLINTFKSNAQQECQNDPNANVGINILAGIANGFANSMQNPNASLGGSILQGINNEFNPQPVQQPVQQPYNQGYMPMPVPQQAMYIPPANNGYMQTTVNPQPYASAQVQPQKRGRKPKMRNNEPQLSNVVMRVPNRYRDIPYELMVHLADVDKQMIVDPQVAAIGAIAEPVNQGPNYRPAYGYIPNARAVELDDNYGPDNDEYAEAFQDRFGRLPRPHNENLTFVGPNDAKPRLVSLNDNDYRRWCENAVPMNTESSFEVDMARTNPYRIEFEEDGVHAHLGLNTRSTYVATCSHCGKRFILDNEPEYMKEYNFCSMACRSAFKNAHGYSPKQMAELMRIKHVEIPLNEDYTHRRN